MQCKYNAIFLYCTYERDAEEMNTCNQVAKHRYMRTWPTIPSLPCPHPVSSVSSLAFRIPIPRVMLPDRFPAFPQAQPSQYIPPSIQTTALDPHIEANKPTYHSSQNYLPPLLLSFLPTTPPYANGSTVLYPLSLLTSLTSLSSLTLFFRLGGLCSSITITSSLSLLSLLSLGGGGRLVSLVSSTITTGSLTILTGLLSLLTSTVSLALRLRVRVLPCVLFLLSLTTTSSV